MSGPSTGDPLELSFEQVVDAEDLRSVISAALRASPVDERSLRRGVWTFVGAQRDIGTSPGEVIVALTQLVEVSAVVPASVRQVVMRDVILWCVEAYFGHLGGESREVQGDEAADADRPVPPMIVSNR